MKKEVFDYRELNDLQKDTIKEVIDILRKSNQKELNDFAENLKIKFKIVEIPTLDINESWLCQILKKENISVSVQGYNIENAGTKDSKQYPIIAITEDIRKIEKALERYILKK